VTRVQHCRCRERGRGGVVITVISCYTLTPEFYYHILEVTDFISISPPPRARFGLWILMWTLMPSLRSTIRLCSVVQWVARGCCCGRTRELRRQFHDLPTSSGSRTS